MLLRHHDRVRVVLRCGRVGLVLRHTRQGSCTTELERVRSSSYEDAASVRDIEDAESVRDIAYEDAASSMYRKHHIK